MPKERLLTRASCCPGRALRHGAQGGSNNSGTVFKVNTDGGGFDVLKEFAISREGAHLRGGLAIANSTLCGTTTEGGTLKVGVLFSIALAPSLRIEWLGINTILIAWPHPSEGFGLQFNTSLQAAGWTNVAEPPVHVGDEWQVSLSPPPTSLPPARTSS